VSCLEGRISCDRRTLPMTSMIIFRLAPCTSLHRDFLRLTTIHRFIGCLALASRICDFRTPFSPWHITCLPQSVTPEQCVPTRQFPCKWCGRLRPMALRLRESGRSRPMSHHCHGHSKTICVSDFRAISPAHLMAL
jgi:hypothetical protein